MSSSPLGPATDTADADEGASVADWDVPEGTLVTFIVVSMPVLGSYARQVVIDEPKPPKLTDAIRSPLGRTPCWLPESKA